jgi:3'-5' exoribonuclease
MEKFIKEFEVGEDIQGFYIVKSFNVKVSSNDKKYIDLTLGDVTGEINGKIWDVKNLEEYEIKTGDVVKIRAKVTLWQNSNQLKINKIRKGEEGDSYDFKNLVEAAPHDPDFMFRFIMGYIEKIRSEDIRLVVKFIVNEYKEKLMVYPAAMKNHHAIRSGLMYHIMRMLKLGESMAEIYPNVNKDLLFAGIILHDIEKINEMNSDDMGIVSEYSRDGQLLGHIIQGIKKIDKVCRELGVDEEVSILLEHMILSHHYEAEYGSPKKPMFPEAELLHYIDIVDARMYDMEKVYGSMEQEEFSDPVWVLDRRKLYKSKFHK